MAFNILIVDNQRDVSKAIRAGIQSLGKDFNVASAMSGEEALLEARLRKFDLLITEVRLTGMSGIELMRKLRTTRPDLKVILLTGSTDRYIRREISDAGAEVFLQKPIEIPNLLAQVEAVLGLVEAVAPAPFEEQEIPQEPEPGNISDKLSELRQHIHALLVILLSDTGENLVQAGDLYGIDLENSISSLLSIFSSGHRISRLLGATTPNNLYVFNGSKHDFIFSDVGESHGLLVVTSSSVAADNLQKITGSMHGTVQDLQAILMDMGVTPLVMEEQVAVEQAELLEFEEEDELPLELDAGLDALFEEKGELLKTTDFDSFWETSSIEDTGLFASADALSYEQARQLGLAPTEEE